MAWTREGRRACAIGHVVCDVVGCGRDVYRHGRCSDHWEPVEERTCGHDRLVVTCGCCGRWVCGDCYGAWNALACVECRERARAS